MIFDNTMQMANITLISHIGIDDGYLWYDYILFAFFICMMLYFWFIYQVSLSVYSLFYISYYRRTATFTMKESSYFYYDIDDSIFRFGSLFRGLAIAFMPLFSELSFSRQKMR